ncbi:MULTISPECIES: flagellar basal body P-ring formation chaperone FlgA [unclassified Oleiphilus]|jgi:flagella basal body P-ring formation protein FlgA|uniref:flagellar basal body P-ring formation chaperone FlgA n=3 Tax=Oleiphilus TaxID=141450 RepID=UPI0007C40842|nr:MULTISPECIES: flagellar basal body P-ring formation chaperone FlgA [unclassified Oleiphilus]KZY42316.1 hypothetical protein A3732_16540 [Oleiphilus sp. HI0050]KZY72681.1 hypothetical protein A3740_04110 [Oleiphilus sp. HI0068]KZY87478.1 hypothetical protein A3741_13575 [Oleiphilus sp. HI0069]KZY88640.1 hypothetical protein A3743_11140 [Oleiphilus sp. HI0072]KZZ13754.1 hypothetical protein A3749_05600 [Oleiphilus sp. HI0078]KZZ29777.1 hypothetical protein A3752_18350 [Oleiphilus sp. HI0081]
MKISRQIFWLPLLFLSTLVIGSETVTLENKHSHATPEELAKNETSDNNFDLKTLVSAYLEQLAADYADKGYRSEYRVGNIDPYHKNKTCSEQPQLKLNRPPLTQNRITIEIRCEGLKPWKLYIGSEFDLYAHTVVATGGIRRGQVISINDINLEEIVINRTHYSHYQQLSDVEGMVARRSIRPGSTIQPGHLTPPKLVKRGDNVVIVASNSAISVRMNGTAMTDGALGQQIPVQNLQSKRVVKARVSEPGLVIITL